MSNAPSSTPDDGAHGDYTRGSMDITDQQDTWKAFAAWAKWGTLAVLGLTFFLVFWLIGGMSIVVTGFLIGAMMAGAAFFFESSPGACVFAFVTVVVLSIILSIVFGIFSALLG